jgi:hypothetical protein
MWKRLYVRLSVFTFLYEGNSTPCENQMQGGRNHFVTAICLQYPTHGET